jgi:ferredoxin
MHELTERVRQAAIESGAALVGFAPIARFDNAPPEHNPKALMPGTQTVVAVAVPQARGTLKTVEEGTYWVAYNCDSYQYLNEILAPGILRAIVMTLEDEGYTSVPIHNPFWSHTGRKTREEHVKGPDAMMSLRVIAVAAGLGELGMSKLFLTPEFGPRQRVFAVYTDAQLEPTPLFTGTVCDECGLCAKECEACAIGKTRDITFEIEGHIYGHASFDPQACARVHSGSDPRYSPFWNGTEKEGERTAYNAFLERRFRHHGICVGRGCLRSCLDHLEKTGRISKKFTTPFIEKKRWKLNEAPGRQP